MPQRFALYKLQPRADGPEWALALPPTTAGFQEMWCAATRMFREASLSIVGCHYDCHAPLAEFFVAAPGVHETYVIREVADPAR